MNGKWGGGLAWVGWVCSDRNINRNNEVIVGFRPVYVDNATWTPPDLCRNRAHLRAFVGILDCVSQGDHAACSVC